MTLDPTQRDAIRSLVMEHARESTRRRRRVTPPIALAAAVALVALTGVAAVAIVGRGTPTSDTATLTEGVTTFNGPPCASATAESAVRLVGTWALTGVAGEDSAWRDFDGASMTVLRDCGEVSWDVAAWTAGIPHRAHDRPGKATAPCSCLPRSHSRQSAAVPPSP